MIWRFPEQRITDALPKRVKAVARVENNRVIVYISSTVPESQHEQMKKKAVRRLRRRMQADPLPPGATGGEVVAIRSSVTGAALSAAVLALAALTAVIFSRLVRAPHPAGPGAAPVKAQIRTP